CLAFTADELGTLDALHKQYAGRTPRQQNPHPRRSLAWAAWLIGRLGGWDGYPSSRPPRPITLKIGIDKLHLLAQGWGLRNVCMPHREGGRPDAAPRSRGAGRADDPR